MNVKQRVYETEEKFFSKNAFFTKNTAGRLYETPECILRTPFQRDRDRITHSKAFRRLMHKMQVFVAPEGDHYRTRLTHTLEVTQIARTIARAMALNEDLTESAALGHDLGHTPFGHSGERALNLLCSAGFRHNEQSLRVTDSIEKLNLTYEVRNAIVNHTNGRAFTKEGQIVMVADRIAYINHDIDDAVRAGILRENEIPGEFISVFGETHSQRIKTMVSAVIDHGSDDEIGMDEPFAKAFGGFHKFMFDAVYLSQAARGEEEKVKRMLGCLFNYFTDKPRLLPEEYRENIEEDGTERVVCDYIAGMTDRYAIAVFEDIFQPKVWQYK
ncbi:MAG: deoxyguanosinetriphosphate triphosphohydrolase [Eubacteriales bacterium]